MKRALLALLPLALHPHAADAGACARPGPRVAIMTRADTTITTGGGVVAMIETTDNPAWEFRGGKRLADAAFVMLAPTLIRIAPPAGAGWQTLENADHVALVRVQRDDKLAVPLAAPAVVAVVRGEYHGRHGSGSDLKVNVKGTAPAGAIAIILYGVDGARRAAWSWGDVPLGDSSFTVYQQGSCTVVAPGVTGAAVGQPVAVAWVDAAGVVSPVSATVKVTAAQPDL